MVEKRFAELFDGLRDAGIARRSARRAASEIEDHFNQLTRDAVSRGASESDAHLEAHAALGTNQTLIERYAARPELRAWSSRWPALWFTLAPIGCYLALSVLCMTVLVLAMNRMSGYLHGIHVAARVSHLIDLGLRILLLGLFPASVAVAFGLWALRRRIALRWPVAGILVLSVLASLINVEFAVTGGAPAGSVGAGIGISAGSLPAQLARAFMVVALALTALWIAAHRSRRHPDAAE
jgi:hypothetical protein